MTEPLSAIPYDLLMAIQQGTMAWRYRGIETFKNPFDLALYPLLLAEMRPATVIEIGSHRGGSALWLADTAAAQGMALQVVSLDITLAERPADPRLRFLHGDARNLAATLDDTLLAALPRPWLVIEDADHQADTTLAVLRFFERRMRPGEFIVVEDGILSDMRVAQSYGGGPHAAIRAFLDEAGERYVIDRRYCDWFGRNVTWNVDGYLRCVA